MAEKDPIVSIYENRKKLKEADDASKGKPAKPSPVMEGLKKAAPKPTPPKPAPKPAGPALGSPEADDLTKRAQALIDKYK